MSPFMERLESHNESAMPSSYESASPCASEIDGKDVDPVAIIGFSLKFPDDADSTEGFWKMLLEKRVASSEFPSDRINVDGHYRKEKKNNTLSLRGGNFIREDMAVFDADFFSISPAEAMALDPMQRKLLEVSYHAFENAGLPIESVADTATSVHTGCFTHDYMIQTTKDVDDFPTYAGYGVGAAMLANRISWFYNLAGPSIAVDSACSSSAMALDMSIQSLQTRSSSMGLVAGCNLTFGPETFAWLSNMNMLSKDSRCFSFDHRANGYARGEGIAVMIVKRLSDALRDGNTIRAIIRSTGTNEDGRTPGITQPSQTAQERLIRETYAKAGLSLGLTRYCEAHGTGTPLGDPLESAAIGNSFRAYRSDEEPMYLGSVKSNIGHTEGASGLAGVLKAVLALENGVIPPNADFQKINPRIDAEYLRVRIPAEAVPWPTSGLRRASVNSFGYGGANAHIVLDDAYNYLRLRGLEGKHKTVTLPPGTADPSTPGRILEEAPTSEATRSPKLLVLSASDEEGTKRIAAAYGPYLQKTAFSGDCPPEFLNTLAYTLDTHRSVLPFRSSIVAHSIEDCMELANEASASTKARKEPLQIGFVFTGQGAQWHAMGRELMAYPIYRRSLEDASNYLRSLGCTWDVSEELDRSAQTTNIDNPEYSQTLCTVIQVALVDLLAKINIKPCATVGHSSGEIAAAYAGGYISRQSAWKIAYQRGVVASKLCRSTDHGRGAMMSVGLSKEDVLPHIAEVLSIGESDIGLRVACINSPKNVTVAGDEHLIDALKRRLDEQDSGIFARKLRVQVAYHSPQMQAVAEEYLKSLGQHLEGPPTANTVPMISSVHGRIIKGKELRSSGYWVQNMVSPVLFSPAVLEMCGVESAVDHLIEIGPHAALQGPIRDILKSPKASKNVGYSSILMRKMTATTTFLQVAGQMWSEGYPVDVRAANELDDQPARREMLTDLPTYPFDHSRRYWFESRLSKAYRFRDRVPNDLLGSRCADWSPLDARWRLLIRERDLPWTADHLVDNRKVYPGTGMLVMAIEAAKELADPERVISGFAIRDVDFQSAMELEDVTETLEVITSLRPTDSATEGSSAYDFSIISFTDPDWVRNIHGSIEIEYEQRERDWTSDQKKDFEKRLALQFQKRAEACQTSVNEPFMYKRLEEWGLKYGPTFRSATKQFVSDEDEAVADIVTFKGDDEDLQPHVIHPATFDAIGHLCFTAFSAGGTRAIATSMPSSVKYAWVSNTGLSAPDTPSVRTYSKAVKRTPRGFEGEIIAVNPENPDELRVYIQGITMAFISNTPKQSSLLDQVELPNPAQQWYNIERKLDISLLSPHEVRLYLREACGNTARPLDLVSKYVELAAHQNPGLRLCQIGASDGNETQHIFENALDRDQSGILTCGKYHLFDVDQGRIDHVKGIFANYGSKIDFHVFDPTADSLSETAKPETDAYDLCIALTHDQNRDEAKATLLAFSRALKQGGKMLVQRPPPNDGGRSVDVEEVLLKAGFSVPTDLSDAIIIATKDTDTVQSTHPIRLILAGNLANERHSALVQQLQELLADDLRYEIIPSSLDEAAHHPDLKNSILVLLSDPEYLCLETLTQESFSQLQRIISASSRLLWLCDTSAEVSIGGSPVSSIVEGSTRSLRSENNNLQLVRLSLEAFQGKSVHHIPKVLGRMLSWSVGSNYEQDYVEVDGHLHTDRLINANRLKQAVSAKLTPQYTEQVKVADQSFRLDISSVGSLKTLHFLEASKTPEEPQSHEVDIQIHAVSIESRDYRRAMGRGKSHNIRFGNASAGVVTQVGIDSDFNVGDRVLCVANDTFRSRLRTHGSKLIRLPDEIPWEDACHTVPALAAARYALTEIGRVRKGSSILIYPCVGLIGDAAVHVSRMLGLQVWTTVHSEEAGRAVTERLGIPSTSVFSHDAFSLGHRQGFRGADVVLCLEPARSHQSWDFVNQFGHVVYMPTITGAPIPTPSSQFPSNTSYSALNFQEIAEQRPSLLCDSFKYAMDMLPAAQEIRRSTKFPASRVVDAFEHVAGTNGSAIVTLDANDEISLTRDTRPTVTLDPNATYVISGGTGGIGRSMARWCCARGARNLILLSRSGATGKAAQALVSDLKAQGVHVEAPPCDVADEQSLRSVLENCLRRMPPIKGCLQASGAYKDLSFDVTTLEEWNTAIRSKVTSSWNLHKVLPSGMDFFVMVSSMGGVLGMISQSSYAGANTYQDALARYRIAHGEKATSLDPGVLRDVGFVTEFTDAQRDRLDRLGVFIPNYDAEILALLDIYCDPSNAMTNITECRPLTGIKTVAQMIADGVDVPFTLTQPLWQHTLNVSVDESRKSQAKTQDGDVKHVIEGAESLEEAAAIATQVFRKKVAALLWTEEKRLQEDASMQSFGLDSLVAIDLRNWLTRTFGVDIPVFELLGGSSSSRIGKSIAAQVRGT
ncbi:ketoacyl-synt-domain-containing protein [Byssothecium circinans]|uniref:Ketoacyl-synt-domain-containing protein n=1 Tax=Byssothecium circinans TaxID=147558 RepID=A0A6A5T7L8_9PLEO|nr:ketoacyl-synt-domain-containing protein [Byssothecium circinans]